MTDDILQSPPPAQPTPQLDQPLHFTETVTVQADTEDDISYSQIDALLERDERTGVLKYAEITRHEDGEVQIVLPGKHDPDTEQPYDQVHHVVRMADGGIFVSTHQSVDAVKENKFENTSETVKTVYGPDGHIKNMQYEVIIMNDEGDITNRETGSADFMAGTDQLHTARSDRYTMKPNSDEDRKDGSESNKTTQETYVDGKLSRREEVETISHNDGSETRDVAVRTLSDSGQTVNDRTLTKTRTVRQGDDTYERVGVEKSYEVWDTTAENDILVYRQEQAFAEGVQTREYTAELDKKNNQYRLRESTLNPQDGSRSEASATASDFRGGMNGAEEGQKLNYDPMGRLISTQTAGQDSFVGWEPPVYEPGFERAADSRPAVSVSAAPGA